MSRALIIVAHGSSVKPTTATTVTRATEELASRAEIRARYDRVETRFLKQVPLLDEMAWEALDEVVVVPYFMADGYFVRNVLPRLLPDDAVITPPLGTADLSAPIVRLVESFATDAHLVLVGHGTERSPASARSVEEHATRLRSTLRSVTTAFVDQEPKLDTTWRRVPRDGRPVVVVPFFAFAGPHTEDDIPDGLGLTLDGGPNEIDGLSVHYAAPVGTASGIVDVLAALALGA